MVAPCSTVFAIQGGEADGTWCFATGSVSRQIGRNRSVARRNSKSYWNHAAPIGSGISFSLGEKKDRRNEHIRREKIRQEREKRRRQMERHEMHSDKKGNKRRRRPDSRFGGLTMEYIFALLSLAGMGYGVYRGLKWMMRAGSINARMENALTPSDLRVLEESAERLTADLTATADECVKRIETACLQAQRLLEALECATSRIASLNTVSNNCIQSNYEEAEISQNQSFIKMICSEENPKSGDCFLIWCQASCSFLEA